MKIAIVHDFLNQYGGAERVVEVLHEIYPEAPIYTLIYKRDLMPKNFRSMNITTSYMQKFPFLKRHFKKYLLFYPKAIESFKLDGFEVVISSSSSFAKGARTNNKICHICYCYTPMRFVWDYQHYTEKENFNNLVKKLLPMAIKKLRFWDIATAGNVNYFIAISNHIKERIKIAYGRDSSVIYPPVSVQDFEIAKNNKDFFLIVSRLNAYKNIDLVIEAFNELDLNLKIVGVGPYMQKLKSLARSKKIEFLGYLSFKDLKEMYGKCRAYIFPGKEDFGISPVEAQACGKPVIALADGGALETIIDGKTGLFFKENNKESFIETINMFLLKEKEFNKEEIRKNALRFDKEVFKYQMSKFVQEKYEDYKRLKN